MKYTMKLLILGLIVILAGCSKEPMIKISEENLASLEAKNAQSESNESSGENISSVAEAETESVTESVTLNPSQWSRLPDETVLAITDYLPYYANQMKHFTSNEGSFTSYVDYIDTAQQKMQVSELLQGQTKVRLYSWNQNQIQQVSEFENVQPFENFLATALSQPENSLTLLTAPLTVGTTWTYDGVHESQIVALYEQVTLEETSYQSVIEVATSFEEYKLHHYYAAGDGLILTRQIPLEGQTAEEKVSQLTENYHGVMLVIPFELAVPQVDQTNLLAMEKAEFSWQTNDTLASAFDRLFTEQGWITEQITVNKITVANDVVTVDFSPGVVAAINAHPATEQGVIPALVTTMANFYKVSQVMLTVNGNGLLPNSLPYPVNGIYTVDENWLSSPTIEADTPSESPDASQTIELSLPTNTASDTSED